MLNTISHGNRSQICAIVHSVPNTIQDDRMRDFVKQLREVANEMFITHLSTDYYSNFGGSWVDFIALMASS